MKYRFPSGAEWKDIGFTCVEDNPREFLERLIHEACIAGEILDDVAVRACELAPGLAIFMEVQSTGDLLDRCSVQAVAAPPGITITDFLLNDEIRGAYCRLDYSIMERGNLFDHPFPHVHIVHEGPPRFPFYINPKVFPALSFIEFLLANYSYDNWTAWLLQELGRHYPAETPDEELTADELLERYKSRTAWEAVEERIRDAFLKKLRNATKLTLEEVSVDFPKMRLDDLGLSYWGSAS
ncbi:MAG: hypothetical protein JNK37_25180 [Verrucomicrobiales bacterium]|nr:hypothetical protein [Verrucomicrobiales bacterium]